MTFLTRAPCVVAIMCMSPAFAAELPSSTAELLTEHNISEDYLSDIDAELAVPEEWLAAAREEDPLIVNGAWDDEQFQAMIKPFQERYPFVEFSYTRGSFQTRVTRPLIALKQGRYLVDVVTGFTGATHLFSEANAFADLRNLPSFDQIREEVRAPDGTWVAHQLRYWCMAYNTDQVNLSDLPDKWADVPGHPSLLDGHLALNDRAMTWMLPLWSAWGPEASGEFIRRLFEENRPSQRKEGVSALTSLTAAGETLVSVPAADYRVYQSSSSGGAIAWHCPEPIPVALSEIAIFDNTPRLNSARIFVNWLLSSEGQISQYFADYGPPASIRVEGPQFQIFPDEIEGKEFAVMRADTAEQNFNDLQSIWAPLWEQGLMNAQ